MFLFRGERATLKFFQNLAKAKNGGFVETALPRRRFAAFFLALAGSWRFWCLSALAAVSIVVYNEIHGTPSEIGSYRYQTLGRERVLLMNVDKNLTCPVTFESYAYNQGASLSILMAAQALWTWKVTDTISLYNLKANANTELWSANSGMKIDRLWSLLHCRHGNTHSSDAKIKEVSNYLPHSATSYGIDKTSTADSNLATDDTAGQIVFQNTPDAQVVSSCYPDGIGTVYFDAVNAFVGYEHGQIAVEVAYGVFKTNATGKVTGTRIPEDLELERDADGNEIPGKFVPPDEAHCDEVYLLTAEQTETKPFGRVAWVRAKLVSVENANGTISKPVTNNVAELKMATGNSSENFYRVWAPIADLAVNPALADFARGPMRFRLKRVDRPQDYELTSVIDDDGTNYSPSQGVGNAKQNALLLVDNVIASYPAMKAWAIPAGEYVDGGSARNVIGWTGVVSTNYPAVGMTGLKATAGLSIATNNAPAGVSTDEWMAKTEASLTWRWRYMDQAIGEWQDLPLAMQPDGTLVSATPMALPQAIGDVELRYVTTLDAPYYGYVDYSGSKKISGTPGYSEQIKMVSSQLNPEARGKEIDGTRIPEKLPSRGTDFFFRLRKGTSEQLEYRVEVCRADSAEIVMTAPCWLTTNCTWKTYLKTTTNETSVTALPKGRYRFRVCGVRPSVVFKGEEEMKTVPWTARRLNRVADPSEAWTAFTVDSATDALMFQLVEDPAYPDQMTYTVVHASFQDFNSWTDAVPAGDPVYTGAYYEGKGKRGSSPDTREFPCELGGWNPISTENTKFWTESFTPWPGKAPADGHDGHAGYTPFASSQTPNGWEAIASTWVCSRWREQYKIVGGDMALQLGGFGDGSLEYANAEELPHGVNQVNFQARVAQSLAFENFAYYFGDALANMKDYVFSTRAVMLTTAAATEFDGTGSISLVGYYQPGTGCYELRAVRTDEKNVQIYLYKWLNEKRTVKPTLLAAYNNSTVRTLDQSRLKCSKAGTSSSEQTSAYYGNLFIRCQTVDGQAKITAGIMSGNATLSGSINATHYVFVYTDEDEKNPLTYGTFGFASANCPAQIIKPMYYADGNAGTFPDETKISGKPYNETTGKSIDKTTFRCGSGSVSFPSGGVEVFPPNMGGKYRNWTYSSWDWDDEENGKNVQIGGCNAIKAAEPYGEVEVGYTAGGAYTSVTNIEVVGFKYNDLTANVRNTVNSLVSIASGEDSDDIVIDNVSFDQWSARSYDDEQAPDFEDWRPGQACPERYVYVNGWVRLEDETQHVIDLQPSRATYKSEIGDRPVSIRAPLMDGLNDFRDQPEMKRGLGLGMISFTYRNADPHCIIHVQTKEISGASELRNPTESTEGWTTWATYDFSQTNDAGRASGVRSTYIGLHGQAGAMRIIVEPQVVKDALDGTKNPGKNPSYGQITITDFRSTDEPMLDGMCWWGWNLRTTEDPMERSIVDSVDGEAGLALALNNSISDMTEPEPGESEEDCRKRYAQELPFVQTPTFYTNLINEVSFQARRMTEADPVTEVAILGARDGGVTEKSEWKWLKTIRVDSVSYETYSYKAKANDGYRSFRLAVIGVAGVETNYVDHMAVPPPPPRILIDEVSVSEGVYGQVGFFDVGAFRKPLDKHTYVTDLADISQQPMCQESWTVQCEVRATQLAEEIRLDDTTEVILHWYKGEKWGYGNWEGLGEAEGHHRAPLARIRDRAGFVYRGSYPEASGAIVEPSYESGTVVQFVLEVKYRTADGEPAEYVLQPGEWTKPSWYAGVDYNATRGGFAAYTILDSVAYGYAWINEVNVYDGPNANTDPRTNQFVEVAVPVEADIRGWKLQFITGGIKDSEPYYTNTVVTFSDPAVIPDGVPCRKPENRHADSGYVFITAGNPKSATPALKAGGYIDGPWRLNDGELHGSQLSSSGEIDCGMPMGIRLVRPSGIIEHQIVVAGTNRYEIYGPPYTQNYSATNFVAKLRKLEPDSTWYFTGHDSASPANYAVGVTNFTGVITDAGVWAHLRKTPGEKNVGEWIPPEHPHPEGEMFLLTARLLDAYLDQTIGAYVETTNEITLYVRKGLEHGTNITYNVAKWHELAEVTETETGKGTRKYGPFLRQPRVSIPIAKYASNDVTVVARTQRRSDLGLSDDDPYTPAMMAWLERGTWGRGDEKLPKKEFTDPDGDIQLAELHDLSDNYVCDVDLRSMYWLDMDPTLGGIVLQAAFSESPGTTNVTRRGSGGASVACRDCLCTVMLKIKSKTGAFEPYAPYTLNGLKPLSTSREDGAAGWDAVTFKITAHLLNGRDDLKDPDKVWMPVRYFVFDENSFKDFQATVQVVDPFYQFTDWEPWKATEPVYKFHLDTRKFGAVSSELLRPDSTFK